MLRKAILFDLDGTLADTAGDLARSACLALQAVGLPAPDPRSLLAHGSRGGRGMLRAGWTGPWDEALFQRAFGIFLDHYEEGMFDTSALYAGVGDLLQRLDREQVPWGVVTNKGRRFTLPLLQHLGVRPRTVVTGDMVARPKPEPDALLKAAEDLGVHPSRCLYVGDDGKDVQAAGAAGMRSLVVTYGYSSQLGDPALCLADEQAGSVETLSRRLADYWHA